METEINDLKNVHSDWVNRQNKENEDWNKERSELKEKVHEADLKFKKQLDTTDALENKLKNEV